MQAVLEVVRLYLRAFVVNPTANLLERLTGKNIMATCLAGKVLRQHSMPQDEALYIEPIVLTLRDLGFRFPPKSKEFLDQKQLQRQIKKYAQFYGEFTVELLPEWAGGYIREMYDEQPDDEVLYCAMSPVVVDGQEVILTLGYYAREDKLLLGTALVDEDVRHPLDREFIFRVVKKK
ncbi:MAG TPA: hypothetical protein VF829_02995 [Candidatus Paceibacterota bacterium]